MHAPYPSDFPTPWTTGVRSPNARHRPRRTSRFTFSLTVVLQRNDICNDRVDIRQAIYRFDAALHNMHGRVAQVTAGHSVRWFDFTELGKTPDSRCQTLSKREQPTPGNSYVFLETANVLIPLRPAQDKEGHATSTLLLLARPPHCQNLDCPRGCHHH